MPARSTRKVALVCLSAAPGMVRYCDAVARAAARYAEVTVFCSDHADLAPLPGVDRRSACAARTPRLEATNLDVLRLWRALRSVRRLRPDVVHFTCTHPWDAPLMWGCESRGVFTLHDPLAHPGERYSGLTDRLNRLLASRAHTVIVHGECFRKVVQSWGIPAERVYHMELPLHHPPLPAFTPAREPPAALFFGRIRPYKGVELFLEAASRVAMAVPAAQFIVAGQGPLPQRGQVGGLGARLYLVNRIVREDEVAEFFARAWVVVLPYYSGTQSGVITLARAYGRPVIVTGVGALPESVEEGVDGFVVEPGNVVALAERIQMVLSDRALADRMGEASWRRGVRAADSWGGELLRAYGFVD